MERRQILRAVPEDVPENREPIGCAIGQRLQQHAVDEREQRRAGADAEGQRGHGEREHALAARERADGEADVLKHSILPAAL
jgi:hypothetical protein